MFFMIRRNFAVILSLDFWSIFPVTHHQESALVRRNILVVEDEQDIAELLALHLQDIDCATTLAADGHEAMRLAFAREWDLVILDLRLPGPDGLSICRALRRESRYVPILMLTSKSSELDRVLGLELGADDYVTKPFSVSELMARVKAIFRRVESLEKRFPSRVDSLNIGPLTIDPEGRQVSVGDEDMTLTAREFDLLLHFARNPGRVFSRAQLLDSVWGYGHDGYEHTVNSHINRLRSKIEPDPAHPEFIVTVWGVGYKLEQRPQPQLQSV
jgi:DNA-binding response OmpR family regulator